MDEATIRRALDACRALAEHGEELGAREREKVLDLLDRAPALLAEGRREKVMRWLGFVQGVLWTMGEADLETLKRMNMPPDATYDATRDAGCAECGARAERARADGKLGFLKCDACCAREGAT